MAQITFASDATPSLVDLDANFTQLYLMRELISSPGYTAATPKFTIDGTFNWLSVGGGALGYGVGSGGAVTQLTSKSTAVTLNKPSGQITMNAANLAAGAGVNFVLNNTSFAATDTLVCHPQGPNAQNYTVSAWGGAAGSIGLKLTNISGSAAAEAVVISFSIIKGSTS